MVIVIEYQLDQERFESMVKIVQPLARVMQCQLLQEDLESMVKMIEYQLNQVNFGQVATMLKDHLSRLQVIKVLRDLFGVYPIKL